jgi:ferredoxin
MDLGVFLCSCGKTSAINFRALKKIKGPKVVEVHDLLCQEDGLSYIIDDVKRKKLDTILVGCTEKEEIFENLAERLSVDLMTLNLREHCGWVHGSRDATEKAKRLLQVGIKRLEEVPILPYFKIDVGKKVLIAGGSPILKRLYQELSETAEVTYIPDRRGKIESLRGNLGNFSVEVRENPIDQDRCISCGKCTAKCPKDAIAYDDEVYYINEKCDRCGLCLKECPVDAIDFEAPSKVFTVGQVIIDDERFSGKLGVHLVRSNEDAITALSGVISNLGRIHRERYLDVNLDQCAAGKSEFIGCQICESICPHQAIIREEDRIYYDEISCMGCGSCSALCPMSLPKLREYPHELLYSQLGILLDGKFKQKIVMFTCTCGEKVLNEAGKKRVQYPPVLPFFVPCISSVPETLIIKALELGADGVLLLKGDCLHDNDEFPSIEFAKLFQEAFGLGDRIRLVETKTVSDFIKEVEDFVENLPPLKLKRKPSTVGKNKRATLVSLTKNFSELTGVSPDTVVKGSFYPFFKVKIDRERCTICNTCMNMCPTQAIEKIEHNKISFIYPFCIACGLCEKACPEEAISLERILDFSRLGNDGREIIMESEVMKCKNCSKPFTTVNLYRKTYSMIQQTGSAGEFDLDEQRELMQYCEECRPIIALEIYQRKIYGNTKSS